MFLSLLQWHNKFPRTFTFVTVVFNFIIFAPFLRCNISIMCHYKIIKQKPLKDQLSEFTHLNFYYYSHYIKFIYIFLVKFHTFGYILKKSAIVATDFHFHSDYVISYICLSHSLLINAVLTGVWCVEMKQNHSSLLTNLSHKNTHSQLGLLRHCGSLIDKQSFLLPCGQAQG
jgi:hypothetical protein